MLVFVLHVWVDAVTMSLHTKQSASCGSEGFYFNQVREVELE